MLWKLISLQKFLDGLFDEDWYSLGLPERPNVGEFQWAEV
jgi:hypothetical protein